MPSNHLILCHPLLLLFSVFPSIRVFSNESALSIRWPKYWSFSFNISPSSEYSGLISFRMDWFDLLVVQETLKSLLQHHNSKPSILFFFLTLQYCIGFAIYQHESATGIHVFPILNPLNTILRAPDWKSQPIGKDPDAGKDWGQEERGVAKDEMVGRHHWLNGHEFEQTLGDSEGHGSSVCCSSWDCKQLDVT